MPSIAKTIGLIVLVGGLCDQAAGEPVPNPRLGELSEARPAGQMTPGANAAGWAGHGTAVSQSPAASGAPLPYAAATSLNAASPQSTATPQPVPLTRPGPKPSLALKPPGSSKSTGRGRTSGVPSVVTVAGSLAVVLGIFFLIAWGMRRAAPRGSLALPGEVFEVLGRAPMANRQQVHLLRCGRKLVLVSVTPTGTETLTEITDPIEVDRLSGICQQARPNSATAAFRQVLGQFSTRQSVDSVSVDEDQRLGGL